MLCLSRHLVLTVGASSNKPNESEMRVRDYLVLVLLLTKFSLARYYCYLLNG